MSVSDELEKAGMKVQPEILQSQIWIESLKALGYHFRLNMCDDSIEINTVGTKLSDVVMAEIRTQMRDRGVKKDLRAVEDAYMTEAKRNAYHPIKDYFNSLAGQWDGVDRLTLLASKLKSDSGDVVYKDGRRTPLHAVYLGRWMIGVLAKALDQVQNPMLTLDGSQGIGKSDLSRWLCPKMEWYHEGPINPQDKDDSIRLMTQLIWEVSELDATIRKADVSALKSFITKRKVTVRKAYGHHDISKPALCSMIGTINSTSMGFLADETGNRRFLVVHLTEIDWSYTEIDRDQLWAQIYYLYRDAGMRPELSEEEKAARQAVNEGYEIDGPIEDWVRKHFTATGDEQDIMTMGDIIGHLAEKGVRLHGSERVQAMEIAKTLVKMGCTKKHTMYGKRWVGIMKAH